MPKDPEAFGDSAEPDRVGPDFFGYYKHEIIELLSEDDIAPLHFQASETSEERFLHARGENGVARSRELSGSLFESSMGIEFSDFKRERLKALLRQGVIDLSEEVDKLETVFATKRLRSLLRARKCQSDLDNAPTSSSFPSTSKSVQEKPLDAGSFELADEVQFLLKSDPVPVERIMMKHNDELLATLEYMEQQIEELLDSVMARCRPMTLLEKQQLQKLIRKLPHENLSRVVDIIQHSMPKEMQSSSEIFVDLEKQNNVTLWRLFCYVEAVEKARKLAS